LHCREKREQLGRAQVLRLPDVRARLVELLLEPVENTADEMRATMCKDSERWAPVVTAAEIMAMDRPRQNLRRPLACSAVAKATPHSGGGPLGANVYRAIDQRVRTDFVVDVGDVDVRRRPPLQGLGNIARPDAPCGNVSEFHQMAPIVSFNLHRRSPV
jgi:hypothetical protein